MTGRGSQKSGSAGGLAGRLGVHHGAPKALELEGTQAQEQARKDSTADQRLHVLERRM